MWPAVVTGVIGLLAAALFYALWRGAKRAATFAEERASLWERSLKETQTALKESENQRRDQAARHIEVAQNLREDNRKLRDNLTQTIGAVKDPELRNRLAGNLLRDVLSVPKTTEASAPKRAEGTGELPRRDPTPDTDPGKRRGGT